MGGLLWPSDGGGARSPGSRSAGARRRASLGNAHRGARLSIKSPVGEAQFLLVAIVDVKEVAHWLSSVFTSAPGPKRRSPTPAPAATGASRDPTFTSISSAVRAKWTSRSGDRKTARRSRVFRHRSSPHPEGTPRKRDGPMMLAAVETVTKADPVWESRRHNSDVAALATARELVMLRLLYKPAECLQRTQPLEMLTHPDMK